MNKRPLLLLLMSAIVALLPRAASAQDDTDPYAIEPTLRKSASTPLPAGIIVNTNIPLWGYNFVGENGVDRDFDKFLRFDIIGYIDVWQFGFSKTSYGNVGTIYMRDVGRDCYTSPFYFQYGSQSVTHAAAVNDSLDLSRSIYAVGYEYRAKYDSKVSLATGFNATIGLGFSNVDVEGFDPGTVFFLHLQGDIGARIPIGLSGIAVQAYGAFGDIPDPLSINADTIVELEFGLRLSGALGLNL